MSEYQYYEFVAIDQPLTRDDMAALRACSSRATITPTSFVNVYNWGDLRANPADWMRQYFDAFVYTANWGSCRLSLRLPRQTIEKAELERFATGYALTIDDSGTHWIINWSLEECEDDDCFGMETGQGWMGSLVPLRDELLRGDLRPLYLGWLADIGDDEYGDDAVEPEVPPGLSQLTAAQQALVEFLEIDPDLLAAAAAGSMDIEECRHDDDSVEAWLAGLRRDQIKSVFQLLVQGAAQQAERRVKSEFFAWLKESGSRESSPAKPRKVAELLALAGEAEKRRLEREERERARQEAERRKQREAYLLTLAADFDRYWTAAYRYAERGTASAYDEAQRVVADLAEAYALASNRSAFDQALCRFMAHHARRGALVRRLVEAGLWEKGRVIDN